jgi:hypothetical protein
LGWTGDGTFCWLRGFMGSRGFSRAQARFWAGFCAALAPRWLVADRAGGIDWANRSAAGWPWARQKAGGVPLGAANAGVWLVPDRVSSDQRYTNQNQTKSKPQSPHPPACTSPVPTQPPNLTQPAFQTSPPTRVHLPQANPPPHPPIPPKGPATKANPIPNHPPAYTSLRPKTNAAPKPPTQAPATHPRTSPAGPSWRCRGRAPPCPGRCAPRSPRPWWTRGGRTWPRAAGPRPGVRGG